MIQMYFLPGKELCLEQGRSFVNSRLIGLMENVMAEYAQIGDDSYMEKITSSEDWEREYICSREWAQQTSYHIS